MRSTFRINLKKLCEISSSHGGDYEADNLLGCTAVFLIELIQLRTRQDIPEDSELLKKTSSKFDEWFRR
jgi:hypothetical protein